MDDTSQKAPHNFLYCERDGEPCFWPGCLDRGCVAANEPKDNLILRGAPEDRPVILDTSNL